MGTSVLRLVFIQVLFTAPSGLVPLASPARWFLRGPDAVPPEGNLRWPPIGAGISEVKADRPKPISTDS